MNRQKLRDAVDEAQEFIVIAHKAFSAVAKYDKSGDLGFMIGLRETGAVRRASMDLSRALSELRKPG